MGTKQFQTGNFTEATKTMASLAPGIDLGVYFKCFHRRFDFLMEAPFVNNRRAPHNEACEKNHCDISCQTPAVHW